MLTEAFIKYRMDHGIDEAETSFRMSGQIIERLPLHFGDTSLSREVFPDGSRGDIEVTTQESDLMNTSTVYRRYVLSGGRIMTKTYVEDEQAQPITPLRRAQLLAKVAFSRTDHWDRESDFYGVEEEK